MFMFMLPEGTMLSAFIGGAISKVINDGVDYTKPTIRSVLNDKNNRNYSTKIYRIIEKSLNIVTNNAYKDSEKLYDAIEKIFNEFKNHGDTLESVKCGLNVLGADAHKQRCENFLEKFHEGIRCDDDLYKTIMMDLEQKGIKINQEEFQKLNKKIDNLTEIVSSRNDNKINIQKREPIKSRTQEYADKWNQNMFLNDFDKRDENAGVNIKLREVYLEKHLPHYIWGSGKNIRDDLKDLLKEYIYPHNENKMLVILGQPGIGKRTLITWIAANFIDKINDILVYRFVSDLRGIDWQSDKVLSYQILEQLGFDHEDFNGKTLILDGLDEVSIYDRYRVLERLYGDWIYGNHSYKFSLIITCRENYVQEIDRIKSKYIILQHWDETQIRSFCNVFQKKTKTDVSENTLKKIIESKDILGIPLILYMVSALNISIEKEGSIVGVYDKIFALDGGIYDRCINNKNFADKHRIAEIKGQIHQISRDIAIWMFENNSEKAYIPKGIYQKICDNVMQKQEQKNEDIHHDFLIGNYFKLVKHCEGIDTEELYFVHRSIYEYFVAETIYDSMSKAINESEESLAGVFGRLFKGNKLSKEILLFLKHKIEKSSLKNSCNQVNASFQLMLQDGMTYHTKVRYKNVIEREIMVFTNMLDIIHIWEKDCNMLKLFSNMYLKCSSNYALNLRGLDFGNADLSNADLGHADLSHADLRGATLRFANLNSTNLTYARLTDSDFVSAYLRKVKLEGAEISEEHAEYLEQKGEDISGVKVYIGDTKESISYKEYCNRKQ